MKKFTLTTLALAATLAAGAQNYSSDLTGREAAPQHAGTLMSTSESKEPTGRGFRAPAQIDELQKYGEHQVVISADFNNLTEGEYGNPSIPYDLNYGNDINYLDMSKVIWYHIFDPVYEAKYRDVWSNIKSEYIAPHEWQPGVMRDWGGSKIFQAGGAVCLFGTTYDEPRSPIGIAATQAHLNTPLLDLTGAGVAYIRFKARLGQLNELAGFAVQARETNGMGPNWDEYGEIDLTAELTDQWKEYTLYINNGGPSTIFVLYATGSPVYLDDIEVGVLEQYVATPQGRRHSEYTHTSWCANWYPVEGADSYLLTVTTYNEETGMDEVVFKDLNVGNVTHYTVDNTVSGQTYYYSVAAVKGDKQSLYSDPVEVYDVVPPLFTNVTEIKDLKYTASWEEIPSAEVYRYIAYAERVAEEDGPFVVVDMPFDNLTDAEGERLPYTEEYTWDKSYSEGQIYGAEQPNWTGEHWCPYANCLTLEPFFPTSDPHGDQTSLQSGKLDLSKDGGKFTIDVDIYSQPWNDAVDENGFPVTLYADVVLGIYDGTQDTDEDVQRLLYYTRNGVDGTHAELGHPIKYYNQPLAPKWQHYTFNVDCGTEATTIAFFAFNSYEAVHFKNLKVTQNYKKGESFIDPVYYHHFHLDGTQAEVVLPERAAGHDIYHQVAAIKSRVAGGGSMAYRVDFVSPFNEMQRVGYAAAGVESVSVDNVETVPVYYNLQGIRVAEPVSGNIYVKVCGTKAEKVAF